MTWFTTTGFATSTGLLALAAIMQSTSQPAEATKSLCIATPPILAQVVTDEAEVDPEPATAPSTSGSVAAVDIAVPSSDSIRAQIAQQLMKPVEFAIEGATVDNIAKQLREATGLPVVVEPRAFALVADLTVQQEFTFQSDGLPLGVAIRELLRPALLRAEIRNDSLVITADTAELARRGIGASRWINVTEDAMAQFDQAMKKKISVSYAETPLNEAAMDISQQVGIPIRIDRRSLEEIGLTDDTPVTLRLANVAAQNLLSIMLKDLDLSLSIVGSVATIQSIDSTEYDLLNRIYWIDGLGYPRGEYDTIMSLLQGSVAPDTWEALGGPSVMMPITSSAEQRPGLLISSTLSVHQDVEKLLEALRESHLGPDDAGAWQGSPYSPASHVPGAHGSPIEQGGLF